MGMGYAGSQVLTIEEDCIKEQCPTEFQEFEDSFEDDNAQFDSIDDFARSIEDGDFARSIEDGDLDPKDNPGNSDFAYIALRKAFKEKTDLEINLCYHDPDEGDRYDDFTGRAWEVDGVYQYTPAGKKYKEHIKKQSFVMFG